jgi:hypothetical protein
LESKYVTSGCFSQALKKLGRVNVVREKAEATDVIANNAACTNNIWSNDVGTNVIRSNVD